MNLKRADKETNELARPHSNESDCNEYPLKNEWEASPPGCCNEQFAA